MKKIINSAADVVAESIEGFIEANSRIYEPYDGEPYIILKNRRGEGKVKLIIGGGSGHEPIFGGFVGRGLADAAVCGNIFASPNPQLIYDTAMHVNSDGGVLFLYGNYAGDNMNFDVAEEMLQDDGVVTAHFRVRDDCASAPSERFDDRRGIAGDVFAIKIAGAACDADMGIEGVLSVCEKAMHSMSTIGLAIAPGTIPGVDKPTFELGENEIEYGMGIHGEPGIERSVMKPADELVDRLYSELKKELNLSSGMEVCVLVNGLGSTTGLEMNIVYRRLSQLFKADGISVYDADINSYCTCQEMAGFSISVLCLDAQLKALYDAPCCSPVYFREG